MNSERWVNVVLLSGISFMYEGIRQAIGPATKRSAPLKSKTFSVITDRKDQMGRWMNTTRDPYSTENKIPEEALDSIQALPVLQELDAEPC